MSDFGALFKGNVDGFNSPEGTNLNLKKQILITKLKIRYT